MKLNYKSLLFLFFAFAMVGMFSACSEDDDLPNGGTPRIDYIRVTRPDASDSLIAMAGQGSMIAIVGQNLQNAREIWFNDQRGVLSPTFLTSTSIITRVPAEIPLQISNQMKIVFANGDSLMHDFVVDISEPMLSGMLNEHVNTGEVATIFGDFFYAPVTVTFTGGVEGEVVMVSEDADMIEVRVPEGAEPGPITVSTNFGETESEFWFRDNRNIIASFDIPLASGVWHGPAYVKASDPDIQNINGNFIRVNRELGPWAWFEMYVGTADGDIAQETSNIPQGAFANPSDYVLKMEVNTLAPLTGANIRMYMGQDMPGERGDIYYNWKPNIETNGRWETVTIPWDEFYAANQEFSYNPNGYGVSFHFSGPLAVDANFAIDNMRVVPKANN